jgi:hypothetical protein
MIKESRLLRISPTDHFVAQKIKQRFNNIVITDVTENRKYDGHKYHYHSAWGELNKTLIYINQLRFKYWYFEPIQLT